MLTTNPAERLAASGLRVTRQRTAVLTAISPGEHLEVDAVVERARDQLGAVSTQAVYDALRALDGAGLVRRIEPAGASALYEIRVGDNHHHLVCRECGAVVDVDVDCAVGPAPCLTPSGSDGFDGFLIDEAEVTWWGLCSTCRTT